MLVRGWRAWAASAAVVLVVAGIVPPWLAERELRGARAEAGSDPAAALRRLDRSASLNPLSPTALISAAVIHIRQGHFAAARRQLVRALERDPRDSVSWMLLGAIESQEFRPALALSYTLRARQLAPRDHAIIELAGRLERGKLIVPQDVETAFRSDIRRRNAPH
jgi:predicted Zn-dependent protease